MFSTNPFAELSVTIPESAMQIFVIVMFILVIGGTIIDMLHKKSAQYFFENAKRGEANAKRSLSSGEKAAIAVATISNEVLTSSEFASTKRRISHLFTMYGFIIFVATTVTLIFAYATEADAGMIPVFWHIGALMLCFGGYWFWFAIRVDLASEGVNCYNVEKADLFILSLLATCTFALLWSATQGSKVGWVFFGLFIASTTVLFAGVIVSKFAHMFFKPAAAYQKRVTKADGSRENLPLKYDLSDPAVHAKFPDIPEYMGKNPQNMGLGIEREAPNHF